MFNQQLLHGHSKVTGSFRQLNRKKGKNIEEKKLLSYIKFYSLQEKSLQGNLINSHCYAISLEKESLQQQLPTKLPPTSPLPQNHTAPCSKTTRASPFPALPLSFTIP